MVVYWIHLPGQNIKTDGYVGVSTNVKQRWAKHKCLASGSHHLKNAIVKYGEQLIWEIVYSGTDEGCLQLEEYWRQAPEIGWNIRSGGAHHKVSDETREKLRQANLGKKASAETNAKRSIALKKTWENPKLRQLKREQTAKLNMLGITGTKGRPSKKKGVPLSEEQKIKTSEGLKMYYSNKANKPSNAREVICIETGEKFISSAAASRSLGFNNGAVGIAIRRGKKCGNYKWRYTNADR